MKIDRNEQVKRGVCLSVNAGLAGAGLYKQAKRVERAMGQNADYLRTLFTTLECEPETDATSVRLLAYAKKVLAGDEDYLEPLHQLSMVMAGMTPEPTTGN